MDQKGARRWAEAAMRRAAGSSPRNELDHERLEALLTSTLRQDDNCIDIGANTGGILRYILSAAPRGRHLAFEPLPKLAEYLRTEFPGVEIHEQALSNFCGVSSFTHVVSRPAYSGLLRREYPTDDEVTEVINVEVRRLDDVIDDTYAPTFIKIDVEGAEVGVLKGAMRTITKYKPMIWFEHGHGAAEYYNTGPADVHDLLVGEAGMQIFDADGVGPISRGTFADLFDTEMCKYLAV